MTAPEEADDEYAADADLPSDAEEFELIARFEGIVDHAYLDGGGVWTIGYGHTGPGVAGMGRITRRRGLELLAGDVRHAEDAINALGVKLNQHQFDASVSFMFNRGSAPLTAPGRSGGRCGTTSRQCRTR